MRALGKEVIEELIMNLKDAGCDEELITKCIKKYNNDDLAIRSIDEFTFDFTELVNFVELHNDVVKKVIVYLHPKVNVENLSEKFNVKYI